MTKNYTFNHTTKTIILSKAFDKKAKNPMNPEFDELVALINKLPNYKVTLKVSQPKVGKKLDFTAMREHIRKTYGANSIMEKKFEKALELGETHGSGKYLFVRKWFRETFPNYKPATVDAVDAAFADEKQTENSAEVVEASNVTKIAG